MSHPGYESSSPNPPDQPPVYPVAPGDTAAQSGPYPAPDPSAAPPPLMTPPYPPIAPAPMPPAPMPPAPMPPAPMPPAPMPPPPMQHVPAHAAAPPTGAIPVQGYAQVPVPPTYDPAVMAQAQQYSGPPVSGPYGYPMMASAIPAPDGKRRGRAGTVILAILTTLFLLAAGVMTTLFLAQKQEADKLNAQVTELASETTDQQDKIDTLQKDLDNANRDLADSRGETDEITKQKKAVADCLNAFYKYFEVAAKSGPDSSAAKKQSNQVDKLCQEADKYLAIATS